MKDMLLSFRNTGISLAEIRKKIMSSVSFCYFLFLAFSGLIHHLEDPGIDVL